MTKKEKEFEEAVRRKNKTVVAKYFALYTECTNMNLKQGMVTLTPPDGKISTLLKIKKKFFKQLHNFKNNYNNYNQNKIIIKYFSNIEFTQSCLSHIHIQFWFNNKIPISKAYSSIINYKIGNTEKNSLTFAKDNSKTFTYVIKDYLDTDMSLEKWKHTQKIKYISSSHKSIPNKVIKSLFSKLHSRFKTKNRYEELLAMVSKKSILIKKGTIEKLPKRDMDMIYMINLYTIIAYKDKTSEKIPLKNKRLIKGRKSIKIKPITNKKISQKLFKRYKKLLYEKYGVIF